ncbi:sulfatase-like hydrolase/transferase [Rhizobium sp. TH2]|uniref:sulfatase-like hydrolase/transferase n=1 Tax=Rhizobium sp. TH2 TaxID=2775403 RepID=UPI002157BEDD|nr:sulfatase-like hydrolase/transferase [Rhizobium sp. TH2]UVC09966.1 sulfatase-like hydrolase/transferase [Rhizobium sp. TH2]
MKNLLLVSLEDMNDWAEHLGGHPQAYTPNLTRLANRGVAFTQAYAAAPACSPARTAALYSRWPWETGVYSNDHLWSNFFRYGERASIIGHLKDRGMSTIGTGKIFHVTHKGLVSPSDALDSADWDDYHFTDPVIFPKLSKAAKAGNGALDYGIDATGLPSRDDINVDWIIDKIKPGAEGMVWGCGTYKPHLPFIVRKEYFDLFPDEVADPPGLMQEHFDPANEEVHRGLPNAGRKLAYRTSKIGKIIHRYGEYKLFVKAYLAAIAYADAKLGLILDWIEQCNLWDQTLIVLWSDHGWQLGEKLAFKKFTLWERALRVPLIFAGAGLESRRIGAPVSSVDIAPTILSLLGLAPSESFSGQNLAETIKTGSAPERWYAPSSWTMKDEEAQKLSISIRSEHYRYIKYWNSGREFYDHRTDPWEATNLLSDGDADHSLDGELKAHHRAQQVIRKQAAAPQPVGRAKRTSDEDD